MGAQTVGQGHGRRLAASRVATRHQVPVHPVGQPVSVRKEHSMCRSAQLAPAASQARGVCLSMKFCGSFDCGQAVSSGTDTETGWSGGG